MYAIKTKSKSQQAKHSMYKKNYGSPYRSCLSLYSVRTIISVISVFKCPKLALFVGHSLKKKKKTFFFFIFPPLLVILENVIYLPADR